MAIDTLNPNVPGLDVSSPNPTADRFLLDRGIVDPAAPNRLGPAADRWAAKAGVPKVIAHSAVPVTLTGSTAAAVLASIPIPANSLGPKGYLRLTFHMSFTNNANSKNIQARWGFANTSFFGGGFASIASLRAVAEVKNRGATGSQLLPATGTANSFGTLGAVQTDSQDTTIDQRVQIVGTLSNAADTMVLESFSLEVVYGE